MKNKTQSVLFSTTIMKFQLNRNNRLPGLKSLLLLFSTLPAVLYAQVPVKKIPADSIVRVAYGTQTKDEVTSAISSISGSELRKTQTATLSNALIGRLPGAVVMHNGGAPGFDDPTFVIRGMHTTSNNGLLIILDGIQVNNINHLSPDEVESVSVLKDAAALALYGAKGANGVLLVTTRRGTENEKINIAVNARYGLQSPTQLPKFAGSYDYARFYNEALGNDGLAPLYTEKQLNGYRSGSDPYLYPSVNWYDEILRKNTPIQDYSVTFDGGGNTAKYFVMTGFMDNQGLYDHTDEEHNANIGFKCFNFRANVDLNITKSLSAQIGLGGNIQDRKFPTISTEDMWKNMATYAPNLYPVRTPDGKITGTANFPNNPLGYLLEKGYQSRHDRNIQTNFRLTEKLDFITEGLNIFGAALFDNLYQNRYDKTRNYSYYEPIITTDPAGDDMVDFVQRGLDSDLAVSTGNDYENNRIIFQGGFSYNRKFNNHEFGGTVFFQQDKYTILGNQAPFAQQNLASRLTYNFKGKYFAEAVLSYSGLENYPEGHRFGFFPAISAGWLIHKEGFWKENSVINYLKLRASAGLAGNDKGASRFNYNQYWGTQSNQGYYFGTGQSFSNALVQLGIANPDITWEKALMFNVGLDAQLFNNKLSVTADFFHEKRSDILVNMGNVTSALSGLSAGIMENRGEVQNYGTEISATFKDKAGDLDYFVGGHFSFARNKITKSYDLPRKEVYSSRQDRPVNQYFGLEAIGFFRDESEIFSSPVQTFSNVRPGDLKYRDQNGDGLIDVNDEVAIGRHVYPEIGFALNTGAAYKGFNLEFFFQGMANRSVYLNGYMFQPFANNANISDWAAEGHWTAETHNSATFPRLTTEPNANNYRSSTFWVRSANLLRLRNVELGYTLPQKMFDKTPVKGVKIFVSGLNLLSWDNLDANVDPETLSTGYPVLKSYTAGLSVKF